MERKTVVTKRVGGRPFCDGENDCWLCHGFSWQYVLRYLEKPVNDSCVSIYICIYSIFFNAGVCF